MVATGLAKGSGTITVTATDPEGLTGEFTLPVTIDDTGYTLYREIGVSNGVIGVFGLSLAVCVPPVVDQTAIDGFVYTIHSSKWQTRSDASAAWTEVAGTERTDGSFCPYTAEVPGDYRLGLRGEHRPRSAPSVVPRDVCQPELLYCVGQRIAARQAPGPLD